MHHQQKHSIFDVDSVFIIQRLRIEYKFGANYGPLFVTQL